MAEVSKDLPASKLEQLCFNSHEHVHRVDLNFDARRPLRRGLDLMQEFQIGAGAAHALAIFESTFVAAPPTLRLVIGQRRMLDQWDVIKLPCPGSIHTMSTHADVQIDMPKPGETVFVKVEETSISFLLDTESDSEVDSKDYSVHQRLGVCEVWDAPAFPKRWQVRLLPQKDFPGGSRVVHVSFSCLEKCCSNSYPLSSGSGTPWNSEWASKWDADWWGSRWSAG